MVLVVTSPSQYPQVKAHSFASLENEGPFPPMNSALMFVGHEAIRSQLIAGAARVIVT